MKSIDHIQNERILFSPLNWGMGHVSRSIPLLLKLQEQNNEILIACDAKQQQVYSEYLSNVNYLKWQGYPFRFKGKGNFGTDLFRSLISLYRFGKKEQSFVKSILVKEEISLVISDHRYYFRSDEVNSIFITHQLNLPLPWHLKLIQYFHQSLIKRFDQIWVVDNESHSFSGKLSEVSTKFTQKIFFLGPLSRFKNNGLSKDKNWTTLLVSGPEPYAEQFFEEQREKIKEIPENYCLIYNGIIETCEGKRKINWKEIDKRLNETKTLISRSGYSTIMDAHFLSCETEWHPTSGQWEQEYLKSIHK